MPCPPVAKTFHLKRASHCQTCPQLLHTAKVFLCPKFRISNAPAATQPSPQTSRKPSAPPAPAHCMSVTISLQQRELPPVTSLSETPPTLHGPACGATARYCRTSCR